MCLSERLSAFQNYVMELMHGLKHEIAMPEKKIWGQRSTLFVFQKVLANGCESIPALHLALYFYHELSEDIATGREEIVFHVAGVDHVGGNMFESIPSSDAIYMKLGLE